MASASSCSARCRRCWPQVNGLLDSASATPPRDPPRGEPRLQPAPLLRGADPAVPGVKQRGDVELVRRLAAGQEGRQGGGRGARPPTGATSSRTSRSSRSRTSRCTPSTRSPPTSSRRFLAGPARLRHRAASSRTSSAGRSATPSTSRASSRPTARRTARSSSWCAAIYRHRPRASTRAPTRNLMFFHCKYLYEATGPHAAGRAPTRRDRRPRAGRRRSARPSTRLFENSDAPDPDRDRGGLPRPASSPWPATWRCCSTASAWP